MTRCGSGKQTPLRHIFHCYVQWRLYSTQFLKCPNMGAFRPVSGPLLADQNALAYCAYVSNFNRIRLIIFEIYTFKALKTVIFEWVKFEPYRGPVGKIRQHRYYWNVLMRTLHSPKENRLLYRLDVTAPNVQTSKTPNSAYLDTLFDLIFYYTISFTHLNQI